MRGARDADPVFKDLLLSIPSWRRSLNQSSEIVCAISFILINRVKIPQMDHTSEKIT